MDSFQGTGTLEWWANAATNLAGYEVQVSVRVLDGHWSCEAFLDSEHLSADHRDAFDFLMNLDPVFTLRFADGGEILVDALKVGDGARLVLTAYEPKTTAA
ncbi:hypothetical protein [Streptomyces sp. NPDC048606]|uniref:hypothetical protein n=1 Tax=Streptomyces sp. NPDC048606 TaxID=3154726 RepID=UPI00344735EC